MRRLLAILAPCALLLAACSSPPEVTEDRGVASFERVNDDAAARSLSAFATDLGLRLLAASEVDENVVVSPASLTLALAMLAEGASGEGAAQLDAALGASGSDRSRASAALLTVLADLDSDPAAFDPDSPPDHPVLHLANRVVLDDDITPNEEFLEALAHFHDAGVAVTDFSNPASVDVLSAWVTEHTAGLIEESAIEPDPRTRLVLQNAVLFGARWLEPFEEGQTEERPFTLGSGTEVSVPTLADERHIPFASEGGWGAVALPYTEDFETLVILPPEGTDPTDIDTATLRALRVGLAEGGAQVDLQIPALDVTSTVDVFAALDTLGLSSLTREGNLRGIADEDSDVVGAATQQTVLRVNEQGTIAAALTEIGVRAMAAMPEPVEVVFHVNRPYLFTVEHSDTGIVVMSGAIRDPRG
ncbi:MAG: serpin family protein [Bowdeniella nasicola]|nr:serpin family protein [Bowdeniella nasicola]